MASSCPPGRMPFFLQLHAFRRVSAFTVNLVYNLEPVYSIAFAAIIFNELQELNWPFWLGIALIVASVVIQTLRVKKRWISGRLRSCYKFPSDNAIK